ncbi:MAG: sulfatase [Phycisphaerae bacterium]|nr:sulfatase [Phycisphaerae bacterium]
MLWALCLLAALISNPVDERPNIVVVMVDDLGWQDTSVPFHDERTPFNDRYHTPNMERLAREGSLFTDGYASAPVCTPTRASLLTGRSPARNRITYWTFNRNTDTTRKHPVLEAPAWNVNGVQPGVPLLPELLRAEGYRTVHAGKAHWGAHDTAGSNPHALGFDVNIAGHASGAPGSYLGVHRFMNAKDPEDFSRTSKWDVPGLEPFHDREIYLTEALQERAVEEIDRACADGVPFFLHFAPYAVHTPIMANVRHLDRYRELDSREAAYATMIESVDVALGGILDALDRHGIAENTIVVFTSDNGGLSAHARGGPAHVHNAPLRSGKGSAYEGGVRVPWIVRWPGVAIPGARLDSVVVTQDLFPTILSAASVAMPEDHVLDGRDLRPALEGASEGRTVLFHQPHTWGATGPGIEPFSAIRAGSWKLIFFHADGRFELYDLETDPGETDDLASSSPERLQLMRDELSRALESQQAQLSIERRSGLPVVLPAIIRPDTLSGDDS